jgi:hypothetical protein
VKNSREMGKIYDNIRPTYDRIINKPRDDKYVDINTIINKLFFSLFMYIFRYLENMTGITLYTTQTYSKPGFMTIKQPIRTLHTINKVF